MVSNDEISSKLAARRQGERPPKTGKKMCPECGTENKIDTKFCVECGKELEAVPEGAKKVRKSRSGLLIIVVAIVAVVLIVGIIIIAIAALGIYSAYFSSSSSTDPSGDIQTVRSSVYAAAGLIQALG